MKIKTCFIAFFILCTAIQSFAVENTRELASDNRMKVVTYEQDNIVPIRGMTFITTQIIFGSNEKIIDVQGGDAAAWTINIDKNIPNILNMKPTILGSTTNLSVVTIDDTSKQRFYHFALSSNKTTMTDTKNQTYVVKFIYPEEEKQKLIAKLNYLKLQKSGQINPFKNPQNYNWDYSFSGARSIMPLHVFDDGKFTYMQLRPNQTVPAVFAVNNKQGYEAIVNFRSQGQYLIVQQIAPQFTLREDNTLVASIFNNQRIEQQRKYG